MKRAMADALVLLGATAVVLLAVAEFIFLFQPQNDLAYYQRGCSFAAEFLRQDTQAVVAFGLYVGLAIVIMARLKCRLPQSRWEPGGAVKSLRAPRRVAPATSDLALPQQSPSVPALLKQLL
jgi:CBS-domain-containing membrane protein